jgi:hypothetical protein
VVNRRLLVVRRRILDVQSTSSLGGAVGRHHAQRPLTKWLRGRFRSARLLFGGAVAVSLLLAFRFGVSIALFALSVLIVCWAAVAWLRLLWSEGAHRLPHQVERVLVGAVALALLAGVVAVVEDPHRPSTDGDAAGPAPGRQNPEAPGSAGAVPPSDPADGGPGAAEARPGSAPDDPFALPLRLAIVAGSGDAGGGDASGGGASGGEAGGDTGRDAGGEEAGGDAGRDAGGGDAGRDADGGEAGDRN